MQVRNACNFCLGEMRDAATDLSVVRDELALYYTARAIYLTAAANLINCAKFIFTSLNYIWQCNFTAGGVTTG